VLFRSSKGATPVTFWTCRLRERLRDLLRASGAKALWIQGWQVAAYWQAVLEAKAANAEVWLRGESNDLAPSSITKRTVKRVMLGWLFSYVDRFLYIGSANKRLYRQFGVRDASLYPARYAIDNERFARQAAQLLGERMRLRRDWGIPDSAFCVLFCGKFISKKRPMDLVGAAKKLRTSGRLPNVHLLFAGSGKLGEQLRASCAIAFDAEGGGTLGPVQTGLHDRPPASFVGFLNQTEVSRAYVAADCLVLPSDHGETWGLVVNEALASALPPIVSKACGCAEDLVGEVFSFPTGSTTCLAERIVALQSEKAKRLPTLPSFSETVSSVISAYGESVRRGPSVP